MKKSKNNNSLNRRDFLKDVTNKSIGTMLGLSIFSERKGTAGPVLMPKRVLGRTKLSVSLLGFGCTQVKDKAVYRRAVELGINYFHMGDIDPVYNLDAGAALLPFRNRIAITYMSHPKASRTELLQDLDNYLRQTGFGYLDVWFVITPKPDVFNEFREAVYTSQKTGKVRWAGMTTHNLHADVPTLTASDSMIDVVMMTYNYLSTPDDGEKLGRLHDAGLGITPMKPLAGKFYEKSVHTPGPLLRWLAANSKIHTIPVIMETVEQVQQNAAALNQPLSEEDRTLLQTVHSYNSSRFCRMCGACDGKCRNGLSVSDLVRTAMYAEGYGDIRLARSHYLSIPETCRQIACDECEPCSVICPNGVAVKERISRIRECLV